MQPEPNDHLDRIRERLTGFLAELDGRAPRWRYFRPRPGEPWFFWTTEPYDEDAPEHPGLYLSGAYVPGGRGARTTTRPERLSLAGDSVCGHRMRKDAKARALYLQNAYRAGRRRPWR
jgi:hypothetical protein